MLHTNNFLCAYDLHVRIYYVWRVVDLLRVIYRNSRAYMTLETKKTPGKMINPSTGHIGHIGAQKMKVITLHYCKGMLVYSIWSMERDRLLYRM